MSIRLPHPKEISHSHMLVYHSDNLIKPLAANDSTILEYPIHQRRPEEGRPLNDSAPEIGGYCSISIIDLRGRKHTQFVSIPDLDLFLIQSALRDSPKFDYDESK